MTYYRLKSKDNPSTGSGLKENPPSQKLRRTKDKRAKIKDERAKTTLRQAQGVKDERC